MKRTWTCAQSMLALGTLLPASTMASPLAAVQAQTAAQLEAAVQLEAAAPQKVMCFWLSYGRQRYMCGDGPIDEVKKKCNQVASDEVGEPVECSCTTDPEYIRDSCS